MPADFYHWFEISLYLLNGETMIHNVVTQDYPDVYALKFIWIRFLQGQLLYV